MGGIRLVSGIRRCIRSVLPEPRRAVQLIPQKPWAKLERDESGLIVRWQSLEEHSRDVAMVFRELICLPGLRKRLGALAGGQLDDVTVDRLAYLVFLHDCGKVNTGFQARVDPKARVVGHIAPLAAICGRSVDQYLSDRALSALGADRLERWGEGIIPLFDAILSHHGKPWPRDDDGHLTAKYWQAMTDYDPMVELATLRSAADTAFPAAHATNVLPLPSSNAFVHALAGLVQLADWIGSSGWMRDRTRFPTEVWSRSVLEEIGLDPAPYRAKLDTAVTFEQLFKRSPYPHQSLSGEGPDRLLILEAETGSGKTEAAMWRFLRLFLAGQVDGLYFALPTRTAAAQLHARISEMARTLWGEHAPPVVMAVPGYLSDDAGDGLPPAADQLDDPEADTRTRSVWAAEHPKRFFSAMISVGTIDQALMAALRVKHAHLRASCLMRHLLVVDEVHASDAYMQRLLEQLLRDHVSAGGYTMLLSATLGASARQRLMAAATGGRPRDVEPLDLETAAAVEYPLISTDQHGQLPAGSGSGSRAKSIRMRTEPLLDEPARIAAMALAAAREGAKVLVVRNTVSGALAVQHAIEREVPRDSPLLFAVETTPSMHHGRFAREDRGLLDRAVERAIGRDRPPGGMIVVGTQTLEQSLDIDADYLITDLCPVDVLLQRLGRLHRHSEDGGGALRLRPPSFVDSSCVVLVPPNGLAEFLAGRRGGGAERHGLGHSLVNGVVRGVYPDVSILEATRRLILEKPVWIVPEMNRWLVESGVHEQALDALIEGMPAEDQNAWMLCRQRVHGDELAQLGTASGNVLRRNRDFMDQALDDAERITTRLGANDRLIQLPDGTSGPFGNGVTQISVPDWMLRGVDVEAAVTVAKFGTSADFELRIGDRSFTYGAYGLHPLVATV